MAEDRGFARRKLVFETVGQESTSNQYQTGMGHLLHVRSFSRTKPARGYRLQKRHPSFAHSEPQNRRLPKLGGFPCGVPSRQSTLDFPFKLLPNRHMPTPKPLLSTVWTGGAPAGKRDPLHGLSLGWFRSYSKRKAHAAVLEGSGAHAAGVHSDHEAAHGGGCEPKTRRLSQNGDAKIRWLKGPHT